MFDDFEACAAVALLAFFMGFMIGLAIGNPQELENGCLVENEKIYCEKVEVNG